MSTVAYLQALDCQHLKIIFVCPAGSNQIISGHNRVSSGPENHRVTVTQSLYPPPAYPDLFFRQDKSKYTDDFKGLLRQKRLDMVQAGPRNWGKEINGGRIEIKVPKGKG